MRFLEEFLEREVKPALGCTEPGAIAFCVSLAVKELEEPVESLVVTTSTNVYKNGMFVGVPGTNEKGNEFAAALGAVCGDASLALEALKPCNESSVERARELIESGRVEVKCDTSQSGVFIEAIVKGASHSARAVIKGQHTAVTLLERDGAKMFSQEIAKKDALEFTIEEIFKAVEKMNESEIASVYKGIEMNLAIARYGLENIIAPKEREVGCENQSLGYKIRKYCLAASAARMAGASLPVMSNAGSGNQGLVATLPVILVGEHYKKTEEEIAKAVALSHLFAGHIKGKLGRLAPICGCVTAAGTGAAAGIVYLLGGDRKKMEQAMVTVLANTTGMMCDGAKESCAFKAGLGGQEAYSCALLAMDDLGINSTQGFIAPTLDKSIANIQLLVSKGMAEIDKAIVELLEKRKNS